MTAAHPAQIGASRTFPFVLFLLSSALAGDALAQARLDGRVVDPERRPVAGATVVLVGLSTTPLSTETNAEGNFSINDLAEGRYDVTASAPGLIGEARGVAASVAAPQTVEIVLRVSAVS